MTFDPAAIPPAASHLQDALDLDLRGLRCPLPVLRTRKALARMSSGRVLRVSCTDPLASLDIPNLLRETGDALLADDRDGPTHVFIIRKA